MTKLTKAQRNLLLARWRWPQCEWRSDSNSYAVNEAMYMFDVYSSGGPEKIIMKLKQDHNIDIEERTKDGTPYWEAISQDAPNMRGSHKNPDLGELLVQIIEGLQK